MLVYIGRVLALSSIERPPVFKVQAVQVLVLGVTTAILAMQEQLDPYCYLLGGLVAIIPHFYFSIYAFRHMGARAAKDITQSFYKGEVGKYLLTLLGFALIFLWVTPLDVGGLFGGYVFMLLVQWWMTSKVIV